MGESFEREQERRRQEQDDHAAAVAASVRRMRELNLAEVRGAAEREAEALRLAREERERLEHEAAVAASKRRMGEMQREEARMRAEEADRETKRLAEIAASARRMAEMQREEAEHRAERLREEAKHLAERQREEAQRLAEKQREEAQRRDDSQREEAQRQKKSAAHEPPREPRNPRRPSHGRNNSGQDDPHYISLRQQAHAFRDEAQSAKEESRVAYARGDRAAAKAWSDKRKHCFEEMNRLHQKASEWIYKRNNQDLPLSRIDLHGLYVQEARQYTERAILDARQRGDPKVHLIVGKGKHSKDTIAVIKPAMEKLAQSLGLVATFRPGNDGVLVLRLHDDEGGADT